MIKKTSSNYKCNPVEETENVKWFVFKVPQYICNLVLQSCLGRESWLLYVYSFWCLVTVGILRHFLTVALVGLQYMVVVFPDHIRLFLSRGNLMSGVMIRLDVSPIPRGHLVKALTNLCDLFVTCMVSKTITWIFRVYLCFWFIASLAKFAFHVFYFRLFTCLSSSWAIRGKGRHSMSWYST